MSEEGAALTTLLSDDERHHELLSKHERGDGARLDGLSRARRPYDITACPHDGDAASRRSASSTLSIKTCHYPRTLD